MARLAQGDRGARRQPGRRASNGKTTGRWRPAASLAPVTGARKALTGGGGMSVAGVGAGARRWAAWAAEGRGTIQDRQDTLQHQLLQDQAENRAFMSLMLQHTGVSIPPVQSTPPPPLQAPVVPAIQPGPPLPTVGPSSSPLRSVTLVFTSSVISSVISQPLVPPAPAVPTTAVAVSVTFSAPAAPAAQPPSELVPSPASTADPRSENDSDPQLVTIGSWFAIDAMHMPR
eukprot:XP_020400902.1 max-binding protein MNT-like [Zea mays]